jgi:aryl-alcohol dehydrogenase-like predicted oxidoreductase
MDHTRLGQSGLKVSRIALGCMSFGDNASGFSKWALDEEAAQPFFAQAVELGITFWDTANVYSLGSSEEIVGRAITKYSRLAGRAFRARRSWRTSTPACDASAPTTSTCTRSIASTRRPRSRRPWLRCTMS